MTNAEKPYGKILIFTLNKSGEGENIFPVLNGQTVVPRRKITRLILSAKSQYVFNINDQRNVQTVQDPQVLQFPGTPCLGRKNKVHRLD